MRSQLFSECIDMLELYGFEAEFRSYYMDQKSRFLRSKDFARDLVTCFADNDDWSGSAAQLMGLLLDEARMGLENDNEHAEGFLTAIESAVQTGLDAGKIHQEQLTRISHRPVFVLCVFVVSGNFSVSFLGA